jgi:hypothetical protein
MVISISKIKKFKACRRAYYFKYIECLEPVQKSEALETGINYHEILEWLITHDGSFDGLDEEYTKEQAMAVAYSKYIYPAFKVKAVEEEFEYKLTDDDVLVGRFDGIAEDGCLVEHKTTGATSLEEYEANLQRDEQILAYMLASGTRKIYYTVCKKPTIRQKKDETDEEFYDRMVKWYDEDTDSKIRLIELERTDEQVEEFKQELIQLCKVMQEPLYYRNTCHCNAWGKSCEYAGICTNYDSNLSYIEFIKGKE